MKRKIPVFFPIFLFLFAFQSIRAESPIETVCRIGDKLIRKTPFKYRLELNPNSNEFNRMKFVDFGRTFGTEKPAVAYAYTELISEIDTLMRIEIEHNDACKIWCNDVLVYEQKGERKLHLVQEERSVEMSFSFDVELKKGRNSFLVKSETQGSEWCVLIQPPSEKDAVLQQAIRYPQIGLHRVPDVDKKISDLTNWLIVGPFEHGIDKAHLPEKELVFGKMYDNGITWTIPKIEILGAMIDPAPWGTTYQWNYHNGGVAWAMQQISEVTGDKKYEQWARNFCDYQMEGIPFVEYQVKDLHAVNSANSYVINYKMLDFTLAPSLPLIYRLRKESDFKNRDLYKSYIDIMLDYARFGQVRSPGMTNYTRETPEKYTTWVDDMFMGIPFLMQAGLYVETPELQKLFFDDAASQLLDFNRHVWDKEAELYMHANYSSRPKVKLPHWSRANGWGIWAMTEVLMHLPKNHPKYKAILEHYRIHVNSLLKYQNKNGFWHNVIDRPDSPEEVSGTAIFTMAMARGITNGWLGEKEYKDVVMNGWKALASEIEEDGTVHKICVGTMCSEDINYYINRPFYDDDTHGSFAVLFAGIEVQRMLQKSNTNFTPVKLSSEEISFLKKDLEVKEKQYDQDAKMLFCVTKDKHYHSDLDSGVVVHETRESLEYAVALLKTEDGKLMKRGIDIIKTVLPMQEKDSSLPYCGIWPYYPEDPLRGRKAAVDYNWADFIAVPLIDVIINHSDYAGEELVEEIKEALILAAKAIKKRNVQPDYTNICIMGTYVCYIVGDICNMPGMTDYAQKRLKNFYDYTIRNRSFTEYNSPTYTIVAMDELLRMKQTIINPQDKRIIDKLYTMCWDMIARHFHQPSGQWCGPYLRTYSNLAQAKFYRLLYNASAGVIDLPGDYPKIPNVIQPHKIPEDILPKFIHSFLPRTEIDTFVVANADVKIKAGNKTITGKDIVGKMYATPDFALASVNQGYMWNQTRPLIAHWGTVEQPSYMQVRFLHDGYDFSAVNIFCTQNSTTVLAIFNIAEDGGDTHPNLDKLKDASFEAKDLRLRIEVGGNLSKTDFKLPEGTNGILDFTSGNIYGKIQVPYANWNGTGYWEKDEGNGKLWADYVLYSGENKTFRLDEMQEAVVGLYLSLTSDKQMKTDTVKAERNGGYLTLSYENLKVKALSKPAKELQIKNDYETEYK